MPFYPGSTVTIPGTFRVGTTLTDPTTVTLRIREPDGTTTSYLFPAAPVIHDSTGEYHADVVVDASGLWGWEWVGTGAAAAVDDGTFYVEQPLGVNRLISLDDVKTARRGMPAALDDLIDAKIVRASAAIASYCQGRKFAIDAAATERAYPIFGTFVAIDDLSAPPAVGKVTVWAPWAAAASSTLLTGTDYVLSPRNREPWEPITSIELARSWPPDSELRVEGVWGFPQIPEDIREACIETVVEWLKSDQAITLQSPEQSEIGAPPERGLPLKARDLCRDFRAPMVG
jgi:hypothetical protein